jgi:hypothetical protein
MKMRPGGAALVFDESRDNERKVSSSPKYFTHIRLFPKLEQAISKNL